VSKVPRALSSNPLRISPSMSECVSSSKALAKEVIKKFNLREKEEHIYSKPDEKENSARYPDAEDDSDNY